MQPDRQNFYPFKEARLVHHNYSPIKKWFIIFYAWDVESGKLKRRRIFDINLVKDIEHRKLASKQKIEQINILLAKGYHFDKIKLFEKEKEEILKTSNDFITVKEAFQKILGLKGYSPNTYNSYSSDVNLLIEFLQKSNCHNINIRDLTKKTILKYVDYLISKDYAGKTINNKISYMTTLQLLPSFNKK